MQYRQIGKTEITASSLALGTWVMGGWMWGGCDDSVSERAILTALDLGVTLIDTAPVYGFGRSEETVGRALKGRRRDSVIIASKCGLYWTENQLPANCGEFHCFSDDDGRTASLTKRAVYRWLRPEVVRQGVENSLRRLRTDYIDLMQVHHASDHTTPIGDTMGALEEMRKEGKIRAIGISNSSCSQIDGYRSCGTLDAVQERFSMLDRRVEKNGIFETCAKNEISLLAYSPLENGLLTGKINSERIFKKGDLRIGKELFTKAKLQQFEQTLAALKEVANRNRLTVGQLATSWVTSRGQNVFAICGARTPEQAADNFGFVDVDLTDEDYNDVDSILKEYGFLSD